MNEVGYVSMAALLSLGVILCLGAGTYAIAAPHLGGGYEGACEEVLKDDVPRGRVHLHGCVADLRWSDAESSFDSVWVPITNASSRLLWHTRDGEQRGAVRHLAALGNRDAGVRFLERHPELSRPRDLEGFLRPVDAETARRARDIPGAPGTGTVYELTDDPYEPWAPIALLFGLVLALLLALLMRKQRAWEETRLAWERSQGIVVADGGKPRVF